MRKFKFFITFAFLALILAACGGNSESSNDNNGGASKDGNKEAETITIKHRLDETKVTKNPKKVVVFDFGVLDTMDKLGIEVTGLPKMTIPKYLSKYEDDKYENVGSLKEPDFEKIHEIKPDLIIISGRQSELYDQFQEIAPTISMELDTANYMDSVKSNVKTIGEIFGKEAEADKEIAALEEKINALHEKATATDGKSLLVLANEGKISAYGPSSRFGFIHDVFGFAPADKDIEVSTHGQNVSFEYIVEKNPDYLFVIDRSAAIGEKAGAKKVVENDLVKKTNAYKNGKIIYLDPETWYLSGGGLESIAAMVDEVEATLK